MARLVVLASLLAVIGLAKGEAQCLRYSGRPRPHSVTITEFGAVGDGLTLNTEPLPSYGQGIDLPGARHRSLINGHNVTDVIITGNNGIVDGQGLIWWNWFRSNKLNYSRPHLVEFEDSEEIVISNLTFLNSPAWGIHPVYCSNVTIHNITIETALDAPLTNGIVPDSCSNMCIENSRISVGHDAISLKSGWDKYGITFGRPTSDIHINVHVDQLHIHGSAKGISFRTAPGRGGYIRDAIVSDVQMENIHVAIEFTGDWSSHPGDHFDPSAPRDKWNHPKRHGWNKHLVAGVLSGIDGILSPISASNINFTIADSAILPPGLAPTFLDTPSRYF
ncbi:hypothetical protein ZWY2020_054742 [Hordeum vulgare]|nr:hypothetical protein ZWY2020_054742 [Hordeum vulgare]